MVYSHHMNRSRHIFFWTAAVALAVLTGAGLGVLRCVYAARERTEIQKRNDEARRLRRNFATWPDEYKTEAEMDAYVRSMGIDLSRTSNCVDHIGIDKRAWLHRVGHRYENIHKNTMKALWFLHRAAELGDVDAMCQLGWIYRNSERVPRNGAASTSWFRLAHGLGNRWGTYCLGESYERGIGVPVDRAQALALYREALVAQLSMRRTNNLLYRVSLEHVKALEAQTPGSH